MINRTLQHIGVTVAVALAYFAAAELGLSLASVHTNVSPIWPPTGIAIASLLIFGRSTWPAIFIGAFAANAWTDVSAPVALGIATGNTLEAVAAFYLLKKSGRHFDASFVSLREALRFVLCAVVVSPMISATIGNLSLSLGGAASWTSFGNLWLTWWLGDGFGALVVAPFLLAWVRPTPRSWSRKSISEIGLLLVMLLGTAMIVFGGWFPGPVKDYPLAHLALPFLLWSALRFDLRVLTTALLLLAGVAVWGTVNGYGPFVKGGPNGSLLLIQAFVATSTLMGLALFAVIDERKRTELEKLKLGTQIEVQRRRLGDIVAHVPGVVWEAWGKPDAATQRIDFVSSHVEKMVGYQENEWISTPNFWLAIVHPDDQERAAREAAQIFASGKGGTSRFRWRAKNGRDVWVEAQSVVVCDEKGKPLGMRGVTMDITPAVTAELERAELLRSEREARAQAEEASRLRDEFLATISHELRTPLNAVVGWSRLLRSKELAGEAMEHALEVIERNAWAQKQIIEDMLDVSRIITGKLSLSLVPVDLRLVINSAIDVVGPAAEAKELRIDTNFESNGLLVRGDVDRLQQVAWNLLSNAVKFTPARGAITVNLRRHGSAAEICIADTGPGIPSTFLPRVFERFSQADSSSTRKHGGMGLGLAIVRHLVELHGGTVNAKNRDDGPGALFTVSLPISDANSGEFPLKPDSPPAGHEGSAG